MADPPTRRLAYLGHHRCGSAATTAVCRHLAAETGRRFVSEGDHRSGSVDRVAAGADATFVVLRNADGREAGPLGGWKAFHLLRDPRDVLVSSYYSHRHSHPVGPRWPELADLRARLEAVDFEEGMRIEVDLLAHQVALMRSWAEHDPSVVLTVRLEEMAAAPFDTWLRIARHLDIVDERTVGPARAAAATVNRWRAAAARRWPRFGLSHLAPARITGPRLLALAWAHRFEALSDGRAPGERDNHHHYRRGEPGGWRTELSPAVVSAVEERFGADIAALGYAPASPSDVA